MLNDSFSIKDKTILITGASSGIGRQAAMQCDEAGANLILVGRNQATLDELQSKLKRGKHQSIVVDLSSQESIDELVKRVETLDGVVYSAGVVTPFPVQFLSRKKIDETFSINYYGAVTLISQLLKLKKIKDGASLVFLSSISSVNAFKGGSTYSGSKAALEAFCRTVAVEFAHKKIRANCISPAMVKTKIFDEMEKNIEKETVEAHLKKYPLGVGYPEDVANAILFFLSDASRWITGISLRMDGGLLLES